MGGQNRLSYLVPDHLVVSLLTGDGAEILMRPCVTGNLMSLSNHALDGSSPRLACVVNCALVDVDTGDEESGLCSGSFELIQNTLSVDVRTVIVCDGNRVWLSAVVDALSTIWLVAELGTSDIASAASSREFVGITGRAVLELAVGCFTVVTYGD